MGVVSEGGEGGGLSHGGEFKVRFVTEGGEGGGVRKGSRWWW